MYLKKIELKGFKSFAQDTEINLKQGINVIVGPNGCGKSNLVDAIRWVLGEANVRNLRGLKGEDVIFNGTDKARALGMASVEMTLDNADNILPIDYSVVTVARKIFRTGESEFSLNKSKVRMKDIGSLFMGTGLGKRGYSIISQGELEQVLSGQPIDRRLILEEASGTIKYRQQRDEVRKRLSDTNQDLIRITDILQELQTQQAGLAVKAEKAGLYLNKSERYKDLEIDLLSYEITKLLKDYQKRFTSLGGLKAEFAENAAKKRANYELLQNNENWLEGLKTEITKLRDELYGLENHENSLKGDIRLSQERINNYQQRLKSAKLDEGKYKEMLVKISSEVKAREADGYTQKLSYHHKLVELTLYENYLARLQEELSLLNAQFELDKANIFTHIEDEANLKNTINEKEGLLNRLREKNTRLTIKNQELTKTINYNQTALSKLEQDIDGLSADIKELSLVLKDLLKQKDTRLQKIRKIEEININLENELRGINNRLITIKDNEEKLVGYSPAVKKVLSLQNEIPGIMGVIGELITVPIGLETAIETIAGRGLENIVVTSSEDAKKVIEYLKANKAGRLTLLPLDLLRVNKVTNIAINQVKQEKGVLGVAAELISCEEAYRKPIDYIFARSLVVENIEVSIRLFDKYQLPYNLVTLAGEVLNSRGAMTGGSSSNKMNYSPLKRRSEERNLIQQKAELNAQLQLNLTNLTNLKIDLAESEQEINNIKNTYNEKELHLKLASKQKDLIKEEVSHTLLNKNNAISELGDINNNITSLNAELSQLENDLENIAKTSTSYTNQLESLRLRIDEKQKDYEIGQARLPSYYEYLLAKEEELIKIKNNLEQFLNVKDSYYDSWQNAILISSKLVTDINLEMEKTKQLALQSQSNADELAVIKNKLDLKKTSISVEEAKIKNLKEILKPLNEHIIKLESSIHNDELQVARLETQLVNLKEKYQTITKQELPDNIDITYTTSEIRQFRAELAKLVEELALIGTVDLDSITEYKEITDRVDFLLKQLGDIKMGKEALEELLAKTEKVMLKQFNQFFILANESFKKTFGEVFEGGEAFLVLEDNDKLLEAGVNLEVKLKGKKTQALNLLSGGERALTCIAFIFALLRLRPAPFCLLDEIDAALDDTNLVRFANFLNKMSENMQFIIITHRQTTMAVAQNIYGITMPEKGISAVLTLSLDEAEGVAG